VYDNNELERFPPTLVLAPGVVFKQKTETKGTLYWFKSQQALFKLKYFCFVLLFFLEGARGKS